MQRRLTVHQRQAILRYGCLALSVLMLVGAFAAVPYIVGIIPELSNNANRVLAYGETALGNGMPTFALGAGEFDEESSIPEPETSYPNGGEFEPEDPIPIPTPGDDDLPVFSDNLCWYEIDEEPALNIINRTKFDVDLGKYLEREFPITSSIPKNEPLVLIVHTHGSESYLDTGYDFYSPDETFRSLEEKQTVVHIGEVLCERLNSLGINTVHDKTMYDLTDFNKSYNYSREGIKKALSEHPSIRFVIDLHRDSVFDSKGNNIKPLTNINGEDCAQLMLVVGTNEGGAVHPNWRDNLTVATHLQDMMNRMYPTLARPINLRSSAFNQALATGSVLLEVGSCGNTVEEAENAITLFAEAYAAMIKTEMG